MPARRAVLFVNGVIPDYARARDLLEDGDYCIAVDGGARHALALGHAPHVLIGDLDSVPAAIRDSLAQSGTRILQFPVEKNQTDLELALEFAVKEDFFRILFLGGLGGRTDQTVANLSLLLRADLDARDVRIDDGREEAFLIRRERGLRGEPGDTVSLLPFGADARGVTTDGLHFPLHEETLCASQTRGVSNRMTGTDAVVRVNEGVLLCIHTRS